MFKIKGQIYLLYCWNIIKVFQDQKIAIITWWLLKLGNLFLFKFVKNYIYFLWKNIYFTQLKL